MDVCFLQQTVVGAVDFVSANLRRFLANSIKVIDLNCKIKLFDVDCWKFENMERNKFEKISLDYEDEIFKSSNSDIFTDLLNSLYTFWDAAAEFGLRCFRI